ncbi:MAG TPA: hypothetical protein DD490_32770, partial [Acidobacteria bacterium]|nr:hypothetical protein [Acidobacteriota bacterium]
MRHRAPGPAPTERLAAAARVLKSARERLSRPARPEDAGLPRAAEWLLDNGYVIQAAVAQVKEDLPPGFWRTLPLDAERKVRVARLARRAAEEAAGPVEVERLRAFLDAAQDETVLTIGEIWAFPALLRLEVLEDLARTSAEIGVETAAGAEPVADRVAGAVLGLRALAAADWKEFFESVSRVERELRRDPAGAYGGMDFATRDRYRQEVEALARGSGHSEMEVAREVVRRAEAAPAGRGRHVGEPLLAQGRAALERSLGYRPPLRDRIGRLVRRHPGFTYLGGVGLLSALALVPPLAAAAWAGTGGGWLAVVGLLALAPAVTLAVSVFNSLLTLSLPPRVLPKMDFTEDLPDEARTLVAVPSLLTGAEEVAALLAGLEIDFLANPGKNLGFALLTDFPDAPRQVMPGDAELLRLATEGLRELAQRHGGAEPPRFFLLHRERRWNPVDGVWMGWERKRGKLTELNHLLAGATDTSHALGADALRRFGKVHFVLTLDADTHLPRGAAARLAATLAHPLNRATLDAEGRVVAGYSVLQPRIEITPGSADRSRHARLFAGATGFDLYSNAVSDVYQDLFGIGIFAGKGIYDPVAFEAGLAGRIPDNALLSHDLFEGLHGRAALVSDVALFEDFPPHLLATMPRLHRWLRGDWQLLPWLLPRVPAAGGGRVPNRLPWIGRWMILDNLRRSLFLPSLLGLFVAAWTRLPGSPWAWTAGLAAATALPVFLGGLDAVWRLVRGAAWRPILAQASWSLRGNVARALAALAFLPCEVYVALDAILRTLVRLTITRRHLLEWTTAAQTARRLGERPGAALFWRRLAAGPVCAVSLAAGIA